MTDWSIEDHEWSDGDLWQPDTGEEGVLWIRVEEADSIYFKRQDAIALARHFKLTPEDLEEK